jgi:hypothetical protein
VLVLSTDDVLARAGFKLRAAPPAPPLARAARPHCRRAARPHGRRAAAAGPPARRPRPAPRLRRQNVISRSPLTGPGPMPAPARARPGIRSASESRGGGAPDFAPASGRANGRARFRRPAEAAAAARARAAAAAGTRADPGRSGRARGAVAPARTSRLSTAGRPAALAGPPECGPGACAACDPVPRPARPGLRAPGPGSPGPGPARLPGGDGRGVGVYTNAESPVGAAGARSRAGPGGSAAADEGACCGAWVLLGGAMRLLRHPR